AKGYLQASAPPQRRLGPALALIAAAFASGLAARAAEAQSPREHAQREQESRADEARGQHRPQRGLASYYSTRLRARRTADGGRFDPNSDTAAHRTLPLGTVARVTNLANGRSAIVTIRDRGPHRRGRIVD